MVAVNINFSLNATRKHLSSRRQLFDEIVLDHINDIAAAPAEHGLDRVQRRAQHLGRLYVRRHHQLEAVGGDVEQGGAGMRQPRLHFRFQFRRRFDAAAVDAERLGDLGEIRIFSSV